MRKVLVAVTALTAVAVCATTTLAADMPVRGPAVRAPVAAPVMSWTGCYVGAGGGYGMWNQENTAVSAVTGVPVTAEITGGGRGYFGTVQVGCDYQLGSNWVIGVFGDWDFGSIKGDPAFGVFHGEEKLKWSWAAGGRVGYLIFPQLLGYVSGGYTEARFDQINLFSTVAPFGPTGLHIAGRTYDGWFLGTGYEYAIGFLPGLFWKTEYRFADYGSERHPVIVTATGATFTEAVDSRKYVQTIRSELVWRFNWR